MNDAATAVRPYCPEDLEQVMTAWRRANALVHPFLNEVYVAQLEQEVRYTFVPNAETYVLEADGQLVGFIALLGDVVGGLFLDPSKHGMGFGKALVDHAVNLKGPLKVDVFRENEVGRSFYERYGFELVAEEAHEPSGQIVRKLAMPDR